MILTNRSKSRSGIRSNAAQRPSLRLLDWNEPTQLSYFQPAIMIHRSKMGTTLGPRQWRKLDTLTSLWKALCTFIVTRDLYVNYFLIRKFWMYISPFCLILLTLDIYLKTLAVIYFTKLLTCEIYWVYLLTQVLHGPSSTQPRYICTSCAASY